MIPWLPASLVNHLWQSTLVIALVWLATLALRRSRARVRCWLWTAASLKFLVPVAVLVGLGERLEWRAAPAAVQPAVSFVLEELLTPAAVTVSATVRMPEPVPVLPWLLLAIWAIGAGRILLAWRRQWLPIRDALRGAEPLRRALPADTAGLVVLSSPSMPEPAVVGVRRPVLLLPDGIADRLNAAQLRALIAHERCHIRCHDNLLAAVHMAVEAIFWYHPLVWWIERRLIDERERACDEAVLQSGSRPRDYAEGILEVCRRSVDSPVRGVAGVTGANLRRRVESIMRGEVGRPLTPARRIALASLVVVVALAPIVGGALKAAPRPGQERPAVVAGGSSQQSSVAFEAASVRVNTGGGRFTSAGVRGRSYAATNTPLRPIIAAAYGVALEPRLLGGPEWIGQGGPPWAGADRFDIVATLPEHALPRQVPAMLQRFLAERFKLVVHREIREAPVYALVLAREDKRLGPELRSAAIDCAVAEASGAVIPQPKPGERGECDSEVGLAGGGILGRGQRLASLGRMMAQFVGRPVVDQTGLEGGFDFELRFSEQATRAQPDPAAADGTSLFRALEEQLGLKLESTRAPIEFIVIDSVERPTEN